MAFDRSSEFEFYANYGQLRIPRNMNWELVMIILEPLVKFYCGSNFLNNNTNSAFLFYKL